MPAKGYVYVIHFNMKDGSVEHLVGFTRRKDPRQRMCEHRSRPETPHIARLFKDCASAQVRIVKGNATTAHESFIKDLWKTRDPLAPCGVCNDVSARLTARRAPNLSARDPSGVQSRSEVGRGP